MTRIFKNIFLILSMLVGATLNASCPPNYTTYSTTVVDSNSNPIFYSICLPSVVSLSVNSGQFNIYITIQNQGATTSLGVNLCSFVPFGAMFNPAATGLITSNPANGGALSATANVCTGSGRGQFNFTTGIVAGGTAQATLTVQALSPGTFSYQANAIAQNGQLGFIFPTITVESVCPTITASNGAGATACSNGSATGNLYNFVTGGNSPYTFASAGNVNGTVSINNSSGIYTFSPNVTGPATGSFNYEAFDIAGCPSNTGTITVPIVPSPVSGNDAFFTTAFGTPVVGNLNFTGGTAPFTITTNTINNGTVQYNVPSPGQFTFTQTAPGASFFDYNVTDANGCVIDATPNNYIYSCNPGFTPSANLFNNVIYVICAPATVSVGTTFPITVTFVNPNVVGLTPSVFPLQDIVPDPTQVAPPCPCDPGLLYLSNNGVPAGTTFVPTGVFLAEGGMGSFSVNGANLPPNTQFSITLNVMATAPGLQTYTARSLANPNFTLTVNINVLPCPTVTGGSTGIVSCNNVVTGDLNNLVEGATGPLTFSQTGAATCGAVNISSTGAFIYTAPIGFTGPCSFSYFATSAIGCPTTPGTVTVTANQGPIATGTTVSICENGFIFGNVLSATGGTPPYNFAIVTNGTLGTATIANPVTGLFDYTPNPNTFGNDFFTFQVTDANGCVSNIAQYNITILQAPIATDPTITGCGNTAISGDLATLVSAGTLPYNFTGNGSPVGGSVSIGFTGPYTFTPNTGFTGVGGFGYLVTDSSLCSSTGAVIIDISSPVIAPSGINLCTNFSASGNLSGQVSSGTLPYTFGATGAAVGGTVNIQPGGSYVFTPTAGFTGPASFGYQVVDGAGCIATGSFSIAYAAPVIVNPPAALVCENNSLIGAVLTGVSGGTLPYAFAIVTNGTLGTATITNATNGTFNYVPNPDTFGTDNFTFQVTDANNCVSNLGTFQVIISQAPITSSTGVTGCVNTPIIGNLTSLVTAGTPPYNFTGNGAAVGGSVTIGFTGPYAFAPFIGFSGLGGFGYLVTDSAGCFATGAVDITVSSPIVAPSGISLCTDLSASGNLATQVSSGTTPYVFGATGTAVGGTVTVQPGGSYVFTPFTGFIGQASFGYQVVDAAGCLATGSLGIAYSAPTASAGLAAICQNTSLIGGTLTATGGTPPYTFALVTPATNGTVTITNATSGTFNYVPNAGFFGIDSFTFHVTDASGCVSNTAAFQITVSQSPVTATASVTGCENAPINGNLNSFVSGGTPPYNFTGNGAPVGGFVSISFTGPYAFTPLIGFSGLGGFGYLVTDNAGCSATGAVDITISSPIASPTAVNACYQTPVSGDLSTLVTSGFPPYVFGLTGLPVGGAASVSTTGIYNFAPATGFSGPGGFVYQVTDSNSCLATAPVSVNVDSLVGTNASLVTCNDNFIGTLVDFVNGGTGTLIFTGPLSVSCGSVTIAPNGDFVYTGPSGFTGPCDFVYQVFDGLGCNGTGVITVTANTSPTVNNGAIAVCQGAAVSNTLATLVNGNPQPPLTFTIVTAPINGTLTSFNATTGAYTYTPNVGFSGVDSFQFQVTDSGVPPCTTNIGTVTITVNAAPVANGGTNITCSNETISGSIVPFVSGGTQPYTFVQIGVAVNGTVTLNADGTYTFVPTPGFIGLGTFQYQVTDANGCVSNVATFTIDIIRCCPVITDPFIQLVNAEYPR